jgi:hypothetical protein
MDSYNQPSTERGGRRMCVYAYIHVCLNGCLHTMLCGLHVCVVVPACSQASQLATVSTKTHVSKFGAPPPKSFPTPP